MHFFQGLPLLIATLANCVNPVVFNCAWNGLKRRASGTHIGLYVETYMQSNCVFLFKICKN